MTSVKVRNVVVVAMSSSSHSSSLFSSPPLLDRLRFEKKHVIIKRLIHSAATYLFKKNPRKIFGRGRLLMDNLLDWNGSLVTK